MDELLENTKTFWKSAELVYNSRDYTSATILYFKCLFALIDLTILRSTKRTPKDHTERFKILKENFPEIYTVLDKTFTIYRDTYSMQINKNKCEEVKKYVARIAKEQGIYLSGA